MGAKVSQYLFKWHVSHNVNEKVKINFKLLNI